MPRKSIHVYTHDYPYLLLKYPRFIYLSYWFNYLFQLRKWHISPMISKLFREQVKSFRVLDAGTGEGQFILPFAKRYNNAHFKGIDRNESNISFGKRFVEETKLKNVQLNTLSLEELTDQNRYDIIFCISMLQYAKDDNACLRNLYNSLVYEGRLLLYVPVNNQIFFPWYAKLSDKLDNYETIQQRQRIYSEEQIRFLLHNTGFKTIEKKFTYGAFGRMSNELFNTILILFNHSKKQLRVLMPIIFLVLYPIILMLMVFDFIIPKRSGNGLLIVAEKSAA